MAPVVDLAGLQSVVGNFVDQHRLIVAAGPLTASTVVRKLVVKNKLVSAALMGGSALFAIQELAGPSLKLMQEQFGYLHGLLGG